MDFGNGRKCLWKIYPAIDVALFPDRATGMNNSPDSIIVVRKTYNSTLNIYLTGQSIHF